MNLYDLFVGYYISNLVLGAIGFFFVSFLSKKYLKLDINVILSQGFTILTTFYKDIRNVLDNRDSY
jgi:hypothetical protein